MRRKASVEGNCVKCGIWRPRLHRDHIVPKFKGGGEEDDNIQWLCANCHEDKTVQDLTGRTMSPEQRAQISETLSGRTLTEEHKANIGEAFRGREYTEEHRAALSAGLKRKYAEDPEYAEKQHQSRLGRVASEATREKLSQAAKQQKGKKRGPYKKKEALDACLQPLDAGV